MDVGDLRWPLEGLIDRIIDVVFREAPNADGDLQPGEDEVWIWLRTIDPLFTRELPPNESAIRLYASWITKYLEQHGKLKFHETQALIADAASSNCNGTTDRLLIKSRKTPHPLSWLTQYTKRQHAKCVVGFGEATHGTAEFFRMKRRLTEFLANEMGFTIFSLEANMPKTYLMND